MRHDVLYPPRDSSTASRLRHQRRIDRSAPLTLLSAHEDPATVRLVSTVGGNRAMNSEKNRSCSRKRTIGPTSTVPLDYVLSPLHSGMHRLTWGHRVS